MINSKLESVFFKPHKTEEGFLLVVFHTSDGIFEVDNCILEKINFLSEGYQIYGRGHYNPDDLESVTITKILYNEEMDFIVILDNDKAILIGADSNFDKEDFTQIINVFNLKDLSNDYLENTFNYFD